MNCPMCGAEVRVVGEGTLSYEPVDRVAELEAGIRDVMSNIRVRSHHGADAPLLIANALELLLERGEG